LIADKSPTNNA